MNARTDIARARLVVWLVTDERTGHRSQLQGLLRALQLQADVDAHWLPALPRTRAIFRCCFRVLRRGEKLPAPDLVAGCGHGTHLSVLAACRAHRRDGKTPRSLVLMNPEPAAGLV
jgi:mitochondrial fission protein ELM1